MVSAPMHAALVCVLALVATPSTAQLSAPVSLYSRGDLEGAAAHWRTVAESNTVDAAVRVRAGLNFAAACQQMGLLTDGEQMLLSIEPLLPNDDVVHAEFDQRLGNLYVARHKHDDAIRALERAALRAGAVPRLQAAVANDLGNALASGKRTSDALAAHIRAMQLAENAGANGIRLNAAINATRLQLRVGASGDAAATLQTVERALASEPESFERAMALLAASELAQSVDRQTAATRSETWLAEAESFAAKTGNERLRSLALGHRGVLLLERGELPSAQRALEQAAFFAAAVRANDLTYRWRWRLAQTLVAQQRIAAALEHYDAALTTVAPLRGELTNGYHDAEDFFQREIKPIYVEFVDALLRSADMNAARQASYLDRALRAIEALKSAELQDYFRDECVVAQEAQALPIEQVAHDAAVLYPIVLPDRIELLLRVGGTLTRRSVAIDQGTLATNALQLRELIQTPDSTRFLPYAQRLHRWLIAPIEPALKAAKATTLVIVPDGVLRVIPFAVLHDGAHYLVHDYALATTPSLTLTAPQPLSPQKLPALLTGVAEPVQGFAPLPKVPGELAGIREHLAGAVLMNDQYTTAKLAAALEREEYGIVHMATHSVVGNTPADSYLLTFDGRLSMTDLERLLQRGRFRRQPVELLTLSACETAIGNERAALGLAGIALKAGARSAVATLWRVSDESSAALMKHFYAGLAAPRYVSKAAALRSAQLAMIERDATSHPAHWAAFMLIGNWL
jgi:CHAT domain-containing protein